MDTLTTWPCEHAECTPLGDAKIENGHEIVPTACQLARMDKYGMCPDCSEKWAAWLDYKIVPPINLVQIGSVTAYSLEEGRKRRFEEWRDTINWNQRLIKRICTIRHNWTGEEN